MKKILIVDDQEQSLYLLQSLLGGHGYQVESATNGVEALESARRAPPELVISDILMPVMDGFSLCQQWNQDEQLRTIPFVFYTATYTDPRDEELALSLGAARFIVKPVEVEVFLSIVERVIAEAESGRLTIPQRAALEDIAYYRMYNETLIRKLEAKMLELETANRALERQVAERREAASEIARLLEESQRRLKQVEALYSIDQAISASMDLRMTLNILLKHVEALLSVDAADILLLIPNSLQFKFSAGRSFRGDGIERASTRIGPSFAQRAVLERQPVIILGELAARAEGEFAKVYEQEGFCAYVGVPLIVKGQIKGVLEVYHRSPRSTELEWLRLLETLASRAATAIDNAQLFNDLQLSNIELTLAYDATIAGWSRAMDLRDKETEGHTQRVTDLTLKLARAMGIKEFQLTHIRHGALLHDIGKMGVPDRILLKTDTLTDEEWEIMRKHPGFAYEMLSSIAYLQPALDIPYCHHEKWDGSGYPQGLKGEEIPLAARIFAVADVWDAVTSDRPYRKGWSRAQALAYIREQSGHYFDPQVVDVFLELLSDPSNHL